MDKMEESVNSLNENTLLKGQNDAQSVELNKDHKNDIQNNGDVNDLKHSDVDDMKHSDVDDIKHSDVDDIKHSDMGDMKHSDDDLKHSDVGDMKHSDDDLKPSDVGDVKHSDVDDLKHSVDDLKNCEKDSLNSSKVKPVVNETLSCETDNLNPSEKNDLNNHSKSTDRIEDTISNLESLSNGEDFKNTCDSTVETKIVSETEPSIDNSELILTECVSSEKNDKEKSSDIENCNPMKASEGDQEDGVKAKEPEFIDDQNTSEAPKKKEEKKKKGKTCVECGKKRKIEFRIHFQGKVHALCSESCYKQFKLKQGSQKPVEEPAKVVDSQAETSCPQCQKIIHPSQGFYPVVGEVKPLCSEDCVRKYQDNHGPPRKCSQCENRVEDKNSHLTWETMVFCSEDCLGKYQSFLGSHCTCCQAPVQQASLGKYCVCFGSDIRQFCSGSCLDDFKKGLKVCTFCQTDLSAGTDGFLAPVGDKGQFKDFCSQTCMERYETMNNLSKNVPEVQECAHCKKQGTFKIQVPYNDKKYFLCCDNCVAGLRCTLKKADNVCASCHHFFECSDDLNCNKENDYKFKLDGLYKFFCSKTCMTTYILSHRRITQCLFCKVKKYNFDMIEKADRNNGSQIFCSLNCLSLYRVNVNAASSKSIRCDNCSKTHPAQYHLTMSDGSIRNFCAYNCVLAFQNQFTSVPALTTTSMTRQLTTPVPTIKTTSAVNSPVIANVVSLAPPKSVVKPLVPQPVVRSPVAVFTSKPQVTSSMATSPSAQIGQVTSATSQVTREVIVQPPAPKSMKNKTVCCKPIMQTKGVNAKTPSCHKSVQTDDNPRPIILPVPVPVYVPTPLHLFSRPVPCPVPFPVPIPIPIIIPSKESGSIFVKHLKQIQDNIHKESPKKSARNEMEDFDKYSNVYQTGSKKPNDHDSNDAQTVFSPEEESEEDEQNENHKRVKSMQKHQKHKKAKLSEDFHSTENDNLSSNLLSENSESDSTFQQSPPVQNSVFETPSFSFDEDEQTLLKVP